ncbi:hypothetical protein E9531_15820 [Lampropedia puyangensis]|uniref:DNA binding HTH domain-containing protein n=2 Tax=Lampropedia puyangensis TaxID=1330072 RepID=A0A4S8EVB8_9BURK|nr:hypothetical protein E9531_15820 [Lampropedia puyangensis]
MSAAPPPRPYAAAPVFGLPSSSSGAPYPSQYTMKVPFQSSQPAALPTVAELPAAASAGQGSGLGAQGLAEGLTVMVGTAKQAPRSLPEDLPSDLQAWLDEQERAVLIRALKAVNYNRTVAASMLGLNLRQIRYRIERLNIPTEPETRE